MKDQFCLPALSVLRLSISLRLASAARLPAFKGALFRGALGYALQRIGCPPVCWGHGSTSCPAAIPKAVLHDLCDAPRSFVIEPPLDQRRQYAAGDVLEANILLSGPGINSIVMASVCFRRMHCRNLAELRLRATRQSARVRLVLRTPLRIKPFEECHYGFQRTISTLHRTGWQATNSSLDYSR